MSGLQTFPGWPPKRRKRLLRARFVRVVALLFNGAALTALGLGWLRGGDQTPVVVVMLVTCIAAVIVGALSLGVAALRRVMFLETSQVGDQRRVAIGIAIGGLFGALCSWFFLAVVALEGL